MQRGVCSLIWGTGPWRQTHPDRKCHGQITRSEPMRAHRAHGQGEQEIGSKHWRRPQRNCLSSEASKTEDEEEKTKKEENASRVNIPR